MLKAIALRSYPELDTIRFISIFLVVLHHQFLFQNIFLTWLGTYGWVGVDIFFVLSGFLITNLLKAEFKKTSGINLKKFWFKRMLRLWPSWLFTQIITIVIIYYLSRNDSPLRTELINKFWHYLLHFGNYSHAYLGKIHTLYGHFWSLAVEEHFYLIWPLLLIFILKKPKLTNGLLVSLLLIPYAFRVFYALNEVPHSVIKFSTHTRFDELIWGCMLALNFEKMPNLSAKLEAVLTVLMFVLFYLGLQVLETSPSVFLSQINFTFIGIASCILVWIATKGSQNGLRKILQISIFSKLGILSYGVYLIHNITNLISFGLIKHIYPGINHNLIAILNFSLPFLPAFLMYKFIDQKFEVFKNRIS
ncbi:MAG: acyltransferase [Bacteriovorax sp.]|jgi:peptidoglycan/LPS O-acetylase OafA/YrhL